MNKLYIFSAKRSNRLAYMAKILSDRWGVHVEHGLDQNMLNDQSKAIINYSEIEGGKLKITPSGLLFEKRIQDQELSISKVDEISYLYSNRDEQLGHDVLSACFYLLSRYEEYLPHRKDDHGRFSSESSLLSEIDSLQIPLVDAYLKRFRNVLLELYPTLNLKETRFSVEVTVDVDQLFLYESKGIARSVLGTLKDLILNRESFIHRLEVNFGGKQDPLNIYHELISKIKAKGVKPRFFFQVGESSRFDTNNPVHLPKVRDLINEISLQSSIGLHPSYFSSGNQDILMTEHDRLKKVTNQEVQYSRQHYLRFDIPKTYRWLENIGVLHDYSMGFADRNGFRAGTSIPYKFYDLGREETTGLTIHPLVYMDMHTVRQYSDIEIARTELDAIADTIKTYGGVLNTTWHPEVLIGFDVPYSSMKLLEHCLDSFASETA